MTVGSRLLAFGLAALLSAACDGAGQSKQPGACDGDQIRRGIETFVASVNTGDGEMIRRALSDRFQFYAAQTTPSDGFTTGGPEATVEKLLSLHAQGERLALRHVTAGTEPSWSGDTGFDFELDRNVAGRVVRQVGKGTVECGAGRARLVLWAMGFRPT